MYCPNTPVVEIVHGSSPDDISHSCLPHLGDMITDAPSHTIHDAPADARCCFVSVDQGLFLPRDLFIQALCEREVTIQQGRRDITPGLLLIHDAQDPKYQLPVDVTHVDVSRLRDVYSDAIVAEGCFDRLALLETLQDLYPDITPDDIVTTLWFEVTPEGDDVRSSILDALVPVEETCPVCPPPENPCPGCP